MRQKNGHKLNKNRCIHFNFFSLYSVYLHPKSLLQKSKKKDKNRSK
ncbi:hypothetical protein LEP1GSC185_2883 [Leptospira licerasiae serovar Varillal str. VAR 010]|nr:hypothetical protein LEP1GSC185_2883 [Leptospira licerasiae serovar Varillal str. VAR 010]